MEQTAKNFLSEKDAAIAGRIGPAGAHAEKAEPTDGQCVGRVLEGDRSAFDILIGRYQRQCVAVSYRLLGNSHDALEVTQDAFLKAFNSLATLQNAEAFGGWLMRIVSNLSLNFRRGRKTRSKFQLPFDDLLTGEGAASGPVSGEWSSKTAGPLQTLESREMGASLAQAMAALPEKQRMAIILFTIEQMPQKEVAAALHCSVEAVKWHVFQGRRKLKEMLKEHL
jgi:RNA polymerase sigma-70 factor (ECF subfamily)